jgi:acyl carrier protein
METAVDKDVGEQVQELLKRNLGVDASFDTDTTLEALGMDSLDAHSLAFEIRQEIGVHVDLKDFVNLWSGHIPVTGAMEHKESGKDVIRRVPFGKDETRVAPTVGNLIDLVRTRLNS